MRLDAACEVSSHAGDVDSQDSLVVTRDSSVDAGACDTGGVLREALRTIFPDHIASVEIPVGDYPVPPAGFCSLADGGGVIFGRWRGEIYL